MPYVMVPVPEEHEDEVMQELLKISLRAKLTAFDPVVLQGLVDGSDAETRRLISFLVRSSQAFRRVSRSEVAAELDLSVETLDAVVDALNARCHAQSQPYLVLNAPLGRAGADDDDDRALLITQSAVSRLESMLGSPGLQPAD